MNQPRSAGVANIWGGFDYSRCEPLSSNDTLKVPVGFDLFTVPAHVTRAEIQKLHVGGEPEGLWYQKVSWIPIVSGGMAQEILAASTEPDFSNAGDAIPNPTSTVTARNAGIRYVAYGSFSDPMAVSIRLMPGQSFGIRILSVNASSGTPFMVYVRAVGVFFRS